MSLETELKLLLEAGQKVSAAKVFEALGQGKRQGKGQRRGSRAQRSQLKSTYFDTPKRELAERGMALRMRRIGSLRVQTLKVPASGAPGLQTLAEFEASASSEAPDLALVGDDKLRREIAQAGFWQRLKPCFRTEFDRVAWLVPFRDSTIEIAWDRGRIIAGRKAEPINELELELKSGIPADLLAAAEALLEKVPFRLGARTKAERGHALLRGEAARAVKAVPAPLMAEDDVTTAFEKIVKSCLDQMRANERAVLETGDPDAIHQLRVALRRFRAIVGLFRELIEDGTHAIWAIDLRWAQRQFGPARDLDVFMAETAQPLLRHLGGESGLARLVEAAESAREAARRAALLALHNPRYASMQLQILAALADRRWCHPGEAEALTLPIAGFADTLLHARHKRVNRLGRNWRDLADSDLHRLRILVKKLRYAIDTFQPLYPGRRARTYRAAVSALQDSLGAVNDSVVGRQILRELAAAMAGSVDAGERDRAIGIVAGWQARGIEAQRLALEELWPQFTGTRKFWRRPAE